MTHDIRELQNISVCPNIVRLTLKKVGLRAFTKIRKPKTFTTPLKQRLDLAVKYREWTIDNWKKVIWSDETKVYQYRSDGRVWDGKRKKNK